MVAPTATPPSSGATARDGRHLAQALLHARSVALVGVSGKPTSISNRPLRYLQQHGFGGVVYPVNPKYDEVLGVRCWPSMAALPEPVDLVLVMVPAADCPQAVREAGLAGAAVAVVLASGFSETDAAGAHLQAELLRAARDTGVRVLGPNCQGLMVSRYGLTATFTMAADREVPPSGRVAYAGQSGAVGGSILDLAAEMGLGLSAWVSTGNQVDLDVADVAEALVDDAGTDVVMLYLESLGDGGAFTRLAARAQRAGTRLVVLRAGRSTAGRRAVASHTGAMLADDTAFALTASRYGVLLVNDVDELLHVAAALASVGAANGPGVAVVTTSGGAGGLAADHLDAVGLQLPTMSVDTQDRLRPLIPAFGAVTNPVDVTAQLFSLGAEAFGEVCTTVAEDPSVDLVAVLLTMVTGEQAEQLAEDLVATAARLSCPLIVAWLAGRELTAAARAVFRTHAIPVFPSVGALSRAAALLVAAGTSAPPTLPPPAPDALAARVSAAAALPESARGQAVLDALGIAQPAWELVTSSAGAVLAARRCGGRVAMKLQAAGLAHKSDVGGVRLDVDVDAASEVYAQLLTAAHDQQVPGVEGVVVQQMVAEGTELVLGAIRGIDGYPDLVTVGLGGITTEIYRDVVTALAPIGPDEAAAMLRGLRAWPLLDGFRGAARADTHAAVEALVALSRAIGALPTAIHEIEVNPLVVAAEGEGATAVDVLMT